MPLAARGMQMFLGRPTGSGSTKDGPDVTDSLLLRVIAKVEV
jgi:hypothetical protein